MMRISKKHDLTQGHITQKLFFVALPLIGTQVLQMAYNLTDMFWLGRLSSDAVAASGFVGLFLWLSVAFFLFGRMGAEIGVSQSIGKGEPDKALAYGQNAILIGVVLGTAIAAVFILGQRHLIGFFNIQEPDLARDAQSYLSIVSPGMPLMFVSMAITGIFVGAGNSRTPLIINGAGFMLNMVLSPILIFPAKMEIQGAALATTVAYLAGAVALLVALHKHKHRPFPHMQLIIRPDMAIIKQIFKWVFPVSVESFLFTVLTMSVTALIATHGSDALSASRVASQVESLTWLIVGGFASAITAFVGQNFGAGKWSRIHKGFKVSSLLMLGWGVMVTLLLFFGGPALMRLFIPDNANVVEIGARYMKILAIIQIPACVEGVAAGAFRGQGKTLYPSISSVTTNVLRVALAYGFTHFTNLGLNGLFIAISLSAGLRGIWIYAWYAINMRKLPKTDKPSY